jgi:hypothetical protein
LMSAMNPTPQESFSSAGSNRPDATGGCHPLSAQTDFRARTFVPRSSVRSLRPRRIIFATLTQVHSHSASAHSLAHFACGPPLGRPAFSGRIEREIPCGIAQAAFRSRRRGGLKSVRPRILAMRPILPVQNGTASLSYHARIPPNAQGSAGENLPFVAGRQGQTIRTGRVPALNGNPVARHMS